MGNDKSHKSVMDHWTILRDFIAFYVGIFSKCACLHAASSHSLPKYDTNSRKKVYGSFVRQLYFLGASRLSQLQYRKYAKNFKLCPFFIFSAILFSFSLTERRSPPLATMANDLMDSLNLATTPETGVGRSCLWCFCAMAHPVSNGLTVNPSESEVDGRYNGTAKSKI